MIKVVVGESGCSIIRGKLTSGADEDHGEDEAPETMSVATPDVILTLIGSAETTTGSNLIVGPTGSISLAGSVGPELPADEMAPPVVSVEAGASDIPVDPIEPLVDNPGTVIGPCDAGSLGELDGGAGELTGDCGAGEVSAFPSSEIAFLAT